MDERKLKVEELQKLKEELLNQDIQDNIKNEGESENKQNSNSKVKTLGSPRTGGLSMYPVYDENNSGKLNIILLSVLSFFFETLFIILSIFIYTK